MSEYRAKYQIELTYEERGELTGMLEDIAMQIVNKRVEEYNNGGVVKPLYKTKLSAIKAIIDVIREERADVIDCNFEAPVSPPNKEYLK